MGVAGTRGDRPCGRPLPLRGIASSRLSLLRLRRSVSVCLPSAEAEADWLDWIPCCFLASSKPASASRCHFAITVPSAFASPHCSLHLDWNWTAAKTPRRSEVQHHIRPCASTLQFTVQSHAALQSFVCLFVCTRLDTSTRTNAQGQWLWLKRTGRQTELMYTARQLRLCSCIHAGLGKQAVDRGLKTQDLTHQSIFIYARNLHHGFNIRQDLGRHQNSKVTHAFISLVGRERYEATSIKSKDL